ncbi:MAG: hypothetical protein JZU65_05635 [Chlorobium sp.]|nr:hypothetical protein [Chlorobium sp.]
MNFPVIPKPPTKGDERENYRWQYIVCEVLNGLRAIFLEHNKTQGLEIADPTQIDEDGYKHVTDMQTNKWETHVDNVDGNPHGTDHDMLDNIEVLDPTDTNATQDKHLSNLQGKVWGDHVGLVDDNPHGTNWDQLEETSNHIPFNISPTDVPTDEGTVSWNAIHHCLDVDPGINSTVLQVGQEEWVHVKNISGVDIPVNSIVGVTGGSVADDTPTVDLVSSLYTDGIATTLGMATSAISDGGFGFVTVRGLVHEFDTSSYGVGTVLYLSDTVMGGVTDVRPIPPSYTFSIAYTLDSNVDGVIYVRFGSPDAGIIATDAAVASQDPTGFINNNDIVSTYDATARTITLTGDLRYVWRGRVDSFTSPWTSPAHDTTLDTNYYLYSDDGINFIWHPTVWEFSDLIISYVYYGTTNKVAAVETHGTMSWQAHEEFHTVIGTYKVSGATLGGYTAGSTTLKYPTVSSSVIKDEDLLTTLAALPTGAYTQLYLTGADVNAFTTGASAIVPVLTNQPYYNWFVTPNWVQTLMSNNSYMSIWLVAVPATADAGSQAYRYLWLQGQSQGSLLTQQNLFPQDLNLGQFANLFKEFVFCAKVIIRYTAGNWSITSVTALTGNRVISVGSPSGVYLSTVEHDTTLTGLGDVTSPLGVLLTSDPTPVDTDEVVSLRGTGLLRTTWTVLKAYLKSYFDSLYPTIATASNIMKSLSIVGTYYLGVTNSIIFNLSNGTYTNNNVVSPSGLTDACTLNLTSTSSDMYRTLTLPAGASAVVSVWVKLGTTTNFCIVINNSIAWNTVGGKCFTSADGLNTSTWLFIKYEFVVPANGTINLHIGAHEETMTQQIAGSIYAWNWAITTHTN